LSAVFALFIFSIELPALPIKIGVPAGESGLEANRSWGAIVAYLRRRGTDVEFEVFENHRVVVKNLRERFIDLAFLDPLWYRRFSSVLAPFLESSFADPKSASVLIVVPKASIIYRIEDLAGVSFALASEKETAGSYFVPLALLARAGIRHRHLRKIVYSGTAASVLKGVAYGGLESGSLLSSAFRSELSGKLAETVRVIAESEPLPAALLAVRREDGMAKYEKLRGELLAMETEREGRAALDESGFSGFILPSLTAYGTLEKYLLEYEAVYGAED